MLLPEQTFPYITEYLSLKLSELCVLNAGLIEDFCDDITVITCQLNKKDLNDSIFNRLCAKFVAYVHIPGTSCGSDYFCHEKWLLHCEHTHLLES